MRRAWVGAAAAGVLLAGCGGSGAPAGDRAACESYVGAHAAFRARVDEVNAVTARGEKVSRELADAWTGARDAAYVSVGDALAVAEDPDLVIALRQADGLKEGLRGRGAEAAATYYMAAQGVEARCAELVGKK